eukprot:3685884-Pyramimonas_sp.AAC.1
MRRERCVLRKLAKYVGVTPGMHYEGLPSFLQYPTCLQHSMTLHRFVAGEAVLADAWAVSLTVDLAREVLEKKVADNHASQSGVAVTADTSMFSN